MTILLPASLAFAACTEQTPETAPVKLEAPVVTVRSVTQTSVTFGWDAVEGASGYSCVAGSADAESTRETTFTMENLEAGTEYSIRVKAVSPDGRDYDSDWSLCSGTTSTLPAPTFQEIEIVNSLPTSLTFRVTPDNGQTSWYYDVITENVWKVDYAKADGTFDESRLPDIQQADKEMVDWYISMSADPQAFMRDLLRTGTQEVTYDNSIEPGTTNIVYAYAMDFSGNILSPAIYAEVKAPEISESSSSVTIEARTGDASQGEKPDRDIFINYTPGTDIARYYTTFAYTSSVNASLGCSIEDALKEDASQEAKAALQDFIFEVMADGTPHDAAASDHRIVDPGESYTVCCAGYDNGGGLFFSHAEISSEPKVVPPALSSTRIIDLLKGSSWTGTQTLVDANGVRTITSFTAEIIDRAWSMDYTRYNELALMLYQYGSTEYVSIDDMSLHDLPERELLKQYGPKLILTVGDDDSISVDVTEYQTPVFEPLGPVYMKAFRYEDLEVSDDTSLEVTLSPDGNTMTISARTQGFYPNMMLYSTGWVAYQCAVSDMVLTRDTAN